MKLRRRRKFTNRKKEIIYISLFFMFLFISIGYAYLSRSLSITGQTEISANSWDIHFANLSVTEGSVTATTPAAIQSDTTQINYSVLLDKPGDFYEFEVDVVNSGTIGGKLGLSSIQGISTAAEPYLESSIKYTNGNPVQTDDLLNPGSSKRLVVRVAYKEDLDTLPDTNLVLNLEFNVNYGQTNEEEVTTETIIQELKAESSSCFTKYNGQVTDQVGQTVTAQNVYFDKCIDKRNVIFNNMCWQVIRTTETGGLKLLYNGEVVGDKCESTREGHKGMVGATGSTQYLSASYLYGDSFTYNDLDNTFILINTETATWSDSTYADLIGKYTCKNTTGECTILYNINGYSNNTSAYTSAYTIGSTNYSQIGLSAFNSNRYSPAMVGYMFNKVYNYKTKSPGSTEYKYGSGFTYDTNTNTYTLSGTTQNISTWSSGYNTINNTHYTCWNTSGTCSTISYIHFTDLSSAYYFDITGGKSVSDILEEMLSSNDVNRYNSSIKGIIDNWYAKNLISKTNMLEDTVYCNARNITNHGGWNPNGGSTISNYFLQFKNYNSTTNLACPNETDQFAVSNNKAKLTYPVALLEDEERYNINTSSLMATGADWWGLSPSDFRNYYGYIYRVTNAGNYNLSDINGSYGVRPVVTLSPGVPIIQGTGSETDPWIVE